MRYIYLLLVFFNFSIIAEPEKQETKRCNDPNSKVECGWHFGYIDPLGELEVPKEKSTAPAPEKEQKPKEEKLEEKCTNKSNWSEECGFVDPGTDFEFQAIQRDKFLKNLLMKSGDPQSVENMQRYQKWLVSKAVEAAKMWEFNLAQKPELSASVKNPVTSYGLAVSTQMREDDTEAVFEQIRNEEGVFVWFTRSDCPFCHRQVKTMLDLQNEYDINIRNVSLDENCMQYFEDDCFTSPLTIPTAQALKVEVVPSFFVYMPKDQTWIRMANGVETKKTIANRIKNFFLAVRSAHLNGVENGDGVRPSVDFKNSNQLTTQGAREIKGFSND